MTMSKEREMGSPAAAGAGPVQTDDLDDDLLDRNFYFVLSKEKNGDV